MIRTRFVCTLGPAVDDEKSVRALVSEGFDVARMNFSHGTHEEHEKRLKQFRKICKEQNTNVAVLMDTRGPEIRLGMITGGEITLETGKRITLTTDVVDGNSEIISISSKTLPGDVSVGDSILIDDGLVELTVESLTNTEIVCLIRNGGAVSSRKSINVPNTILSLPSMTEQDERDLLFAIKHDFDFVAISFARKKEDIIDYSRFLEKNGGGGIKLIAKIENREGVNNIDDIIRLSDGIMIARGDLGVEISVEEIPVVQKQLIEKCNKAGKPVITATQMLDSMIRNPRPTRAEVTDVANAVFDGTSALMLSGETASGKYPIQSLATMRKIAKQAESSIDYWERFRITDFDEPGVQSITSAIGHATCSTARDLGASAIIAVTTSGETARRVARYRPKCPVIAAVTSKKAITQLKLHWGVVPVLSEVMETTDELFTNAVEAALKTGYVKNGDVTIITSGVPLGVSGTTNMLKVHMVGNVLVKGMGIGNRVANGSAWVIGINDKPQENLLDKGRIFVVEELTENILPILRFAAGLVICSGKKDDRAVMIEQTLSIPVIVNAEGGMSLMKTGSYIKVDAAKGIVELV
ncbi:MAG: pyruvate kinase [Ruminococcaceae bacterium]|nr:pyruvate kinase [Oscillospiraceae bacterium]